VLLAVGNLPRREREYWRAMFETYIFSDEGAEHIPPQARGFLGPLTPQLRASLKQRLKAASLKS
jgi:hypothetical protein